MADMQKPGLFVTLWRFFSGAHLDGRVYTNATWTKAGTHPKARLTWWNSRPRLHRAAIRITAIVGPVSWIYLYVRYHYWTTVLTLAMVPYTLHNGWAFVVARIRRGVRVPEQLRPSESSEAQNVLAELTFTEEDGSAVKRTVRRAK